MENNRFNKEFWLEEAQRVGQLGFYILDIGADRWESSAVLDQIAGLSQIYPRTLEGWRELLHPDDREDLLRYWKRQLDTGEMIDRQYRVVRPDTGAILWVHDRARVIVENGKPSYQVGTIQDITERMNLESGLDSVQQHYAQLFEESPVALFVHVDGRIAVANGAGCRLLGAQDRARIIGTKVMDYVHPDYQDAVRDRIHEVQDHHRATRWMKEKLIRLDGSLVDVEIMSMPYRWGERTASQVVVKDITEQMKLEEVLKAGERKYRMLSAELEKKQALLRSLIDSIPDLIFYKDVNSVYLGCNAAFENYCGMSEEELVGKTDRDLFPEETAKLFRSMDLKMLELGRANRNDEWVRYPDGRDVLLETLKTPYYTHDGTLQGLIGISRDITLRSQQEEAIREAKEAAENANAAKSEFIANMSHEIRTPLNAILGLSEVLASAVEDDDLKLCARTVHQAGSRLLVMINDILDLSKIEAGMMRLSPTPVDLRALLEELLQTFSYDSRSQGLELQAACGPEVPELLLLDEIRLRQVLLNLVGNAVKFTEQGAVWIRVSSAPGNEGLALRISVQDTGIGIPEAVQEQVFEPFVQHVPEGAAHAGGTGLGLSITRKLVHLMGGQLEVTSTPGKGSCFTLSLDGVAAVPVHTKGGVSQETEPERIRFHPARILIADDIDFNRELFRILLKDSGLSLTFVSSGEEVIPLAATLAPQLIILDARMSGMDGFETVRLLKQNPETRGIPVILSSATPYAPQEALAAGFSDLLPKPLHFPRVWSTLQRYLKTC